MSNERLNPDKSSSAKPGCDSSPICASTSPTPDKAPPECDFSLVGCVLNDPFLGNSSTHIAEQCVDALMVALNCCAGPMHLQQAGNHLQRQDGHEGTPQYRWDRDARANTTDLSNEHTMKR